MNLKKNKMKYLSLAVSSLLLSGLYGSAHAKDYESEMIIVHPFQWSYNSIAKECTEYLGPAGFDGIQISQPAEHISRTDVWWAVYQPINFKNFTTMTGNEAELRAMIKACNEAGVKVFADAVLNQRGSGGGTGLGGSPFSDSNYQDGFSYDDFHKDGSCKINYGDANSVRNCRLSGMPDTATDQDSTQDKIAEYLNTLMDMGIYGFRIDAAKHMGYNDINSFIGKVEKKAGKRPPIYLEVIGANEAADILPDKYMFIKNSVVTDFSYVGNIAGIFHQGGDFGKALSLGGSYASDEVEIFVNNHDDEAKRCSAGSCSMNTQNNPYYAMAQSWMVVWPYGKVRQVYSGYAFSEHDPAGPISSPRCEGGWLCQHREPMVLNAPRFARATRGTAVSTSGYEDNALWMNRGAKGFYVMNTGSNSFTKTFSVNLPDGEYCDILNTVDPCGGRKVTVSGGKATVTVDGLKAAAICVGDYCGPQVDPCEKDPSSASCVCKGETTNAQGVCVSYCQSNQSEENCECLLNPNSENCQTLYTTSKNLCFAGTTNNWAQSKMTFNKKTGYWELDLELTGTGDKSGDQRFKITDGCSWQGTIYGTSGSDGKLAVNSSETGDVKVSLTGSYTLKINDSDMTYEFVKKQDSTNHAPKAEFSASANKLTVSFTNKSTDEDGDTLTYAWDFGDGNKSTEKSPTHTYKNEGSYIVKLVVTDPSKASSTASNTVQVSDGQVDTSIYRSVALRTSENDWGTVLFQKTSEQDVWVLTQFEFTKGSNNKFKIEAVPTANNQCVLLGGKVGSPLNSQEFMTAEDGRYNITFNAKTEVVTMEPVVDCGTTKDEKIQKCGFMECNTGSACVDGLCLPGQDCAYVDTPVGNTKQNCAADNTTNNCETSSLAYEFLGANYTKEKTTFRLWSPESSNVTVDVDGKTYTMTKANINGYEDVYEVVVEGDLDLVPYQFKVNGKAVRDPYGKMVVPTSYSGSDGKNVVASDNRNVVMNMRSTDLEDGWAVRPVLKNREDAIVYEVHVRDFTIDASSGVDSKNRGRYLGMVQTKTKNASGLATGIDHLKELGVTHVQLLPVYDFGSCSDVDSQSDACYNWGYDPVNFNVPEDRYTSVFNTEEYKKKVNEFKTMVNEFHKNGIRVIMDVVYNHTYNKEMFENISSKYYTSTDLSGCGNSIDAQKAMVSRMIRDSLEYWATEYNIDGFRFDLVGIFDMDDFKSWGQYLNDKYPGRNFLIYGEPWNGYAKDPSESSRVRMGTIRQGASAHVGIFNGKYRECLKGDSDDTKGGFLFNQQYNDLGAGVSNNYECVSAGVKGAIGDNTNSWTPLFAADPEQSVNYITAHDNLIWADKIAKMTSSSTYAKRLQSYGNGVLLVSQGIPFIHAGDEFARTKNGDKNSYKSTGGVNDIHWDLKTSNMDIFNYFKGMIAMRNAHPGFRFTTKSAIEANVKTSELGNGGVIVDINGAAAGDEWKQIKVVINSYENKEISGVDGWNKKVHGVTVAEDGTTGTNVAEGTAVTIWYKK